MQQPLENHENESKFESDVFSKLKEEKLSLIGQHCHMKGSFIMKGLFRLSGIMEGELLMKEKDDKFVLERNGVFIGKLRGHTIEILGTLDGEIYCDGKVILLPSAKVTGNILADKISVYPGAKHNGEIKTKEKKS
jgi:cytoskeletal protein CcmA (bactofilin family)